MLVVRRAMVVVSKDMEAVLEVKKVLMVKVIIIVLVKVISAKVILGLSAKVILANLR